MSEVMTEVKRNPVARRYPKGFGWFAVGAVALVAALTVPMARDVIHTQIYAITGVVFSLPSLLQSNESRLKETEEKRQAVAARHPEDVTLQASLTPTRSAESSLANGTTIPESLAEAKRLYNLVGNFPDPPISCAAVLRTLSGAGISIERPEEELLSSKSNNAAPVKKISPLINTQETLALFDEAATRGAELEPNNAFFPTMRAIGLLTANRDEEASKSLQRAAKCSEWKEHISNITEGRLRLIEEVNGVKTPVIARMAVAFAEPYPHYASLRTLSRVMTALAMQKEIAGDKEGGLAIRMNLARIGAKMRVQSHTAIGSLVGIAITSITSSRPNGAMLDGGKNSEEKSARYFTEYISYLKSIGHDKEAVWFTAERQKGIEVKGAVSAGLQSGIYDFRWMAWNITGWVACGLTLFYLTMVIIVGGISSVLLRRPNFPGGIWLVFGFASGVTFLFFAVGVIFYYGAVNSLRGIVNQSQDSDGANFWLYIPGFLLAALVIASPWIISTIVFARKAKRAGEPIGTGILRGFRSDMLKSVGIFLFLYAVAATYTGWNETKLTGDFTQMRQHEGRYLAEIIHASWPGEVDFTSKR